MPSFSAGYIKRNPVKAPSSVVRYTFELTILLSHLKITVALSSVPPSISYSPARRLYTLLHISFALSCGFSAWTVILSIFWYPYEKTCIQA